MTYTRECERCKRQITLPRKNSSKRFCDSCRKERLTESAAQSSLSRRNLKEHIYISDTLRINPKGYAYELIDGKWIPQHRHAMTQILGRDLLPGESVHHKNGIRHDNGPENLELWIGGIRYGQRATDVSCPNCGETYWNALSMA